MHRAMRQPRWRFSELIWTFTYLFVFRESSLAERMFPDLSIGLVENCRDDVSHYNVTAFGYVIQLQRQCVDTAEAYQLLKAVFAFNNDGINAIVLLGYGTSVQAEHILLELNTTTVIQWGPGPSYLGKPTEETYTAVRDGIHDATAANEQPPPADPDSARSYCVVEQGMAQENNGSLIDMVAVRGPNILTAIVVKHLHWTTLYVIHETATEQETTLLVDLLSAHGVLLIIYNIDSESSFRTFLDDVYRAGVTSSTGINFVVLCRLGCVSRVFDTANQFDDKANKPDKTILAQLSRWLAVVYDHTVGDPDTLRDLARNLNNVVLVELPLFPQGNLRENFDATLDSILLEYDIRTQEIDIWENRTMRDFVIHNLTMRASMQSRAPPCEGYLVETLMWTNTGREFNPVGYVSVGGEVVIAHKVFPNTNFGYNKRNFHVSTLHYSPFVIKHMINGTAHYQGICFDLLKELARTLNFTYTITEPADQKWGSPTGEGENITFNGMIGQLQREEVDMVAADISIQKEREMVMDFTFPFFYGETGVLLRKPDPNEHKWRTLVDPFKIEVLVAIGLTLPVVSLVAFLIEKYNPFYSTPMEAHEAATERYGMRTFQDAFWYMYGALLSQGGVNLPDSMAGRTFVSCWWLFSIIVVGTYCGNLIAFLTVSKVKPPFDTLNQMAQLAGEYKWGLQAGTHWEFIFKTSTRPEFRAIGDLMFEFNRSDPSILSVNVEDHLRKVREGGYAWIGDTVIIEINLAKDCNLMMIKEKFLPLKYAFGFPNNSPHARIFSDQMISIHESGLLHVWKRRWWPKSNICAGPIVMEAKPISVIDVQSAFYVAAGGMLIGFMAFSAEVLIGKYMKCRLKKGLDNVSHAISRRGTPRRLTESPL